jgi:hypothetical protein
MAKPQRKAFDAALEWAAMGSNIDILAAVERVEAA